MKASAMSSRKRATPSGVRLTLEDVAVVKGMLSRGDRQHDIAAWFGVNGGRIGDIATGAKYGAVIEAAEFDLPPPGPYLSGRAAQTMLDELVSMRRAVR